MPATAAIAPAAPRHDTILTIYAFRDFEAGEDPAAYRGDQLQKAGCSHQRLSIAMASGSVVCARSMAESTSPKMASAAPNVCETNSFIFRPNISSSFEKSRPSGLNTGSIHSFALGSYEPLGKPAVTLVVEARELELSQICFVSQEVFQPRPKSRRNRPTVV